eukprot:8999171-Pyramimonas_sp.AAC.1
MTQVSQRLGRNLKLLRAPPRRRSRKRTRALEALVALPEFACPTPGVTRTLNPGRTKSQRALPRDPVQ